MQKKLAVGVCVCVCVCKTCKGTFQMLAFSFFPANSHKLKIWRHHSEYPQEYYPIWAFRNLLVKVLVFNFTIELLILLHFQGARKSMTPLLHSSVIEEGYKYPSGRYF